MFVTFLERNRWAEGNVMRRESWTEVKEGSLEERKFSRVKVICPVSGLLGHSALGPWEWD